MTKKDIKGIVENMRINDYLNIRPTPTGTGGEEKKVVGGGGFTAVDRRYSDLTRSPSDGKTTQMTRSLVARKLRGEQFPADHIKAAEMFVEKYNGKDHTAPAGIAMKDVFNRCPEFNGLGKKG